MTSSDRRLARLTGEHDLAVREFVTRAASIPPSRWQTPRAPGKWTPAQETRHVTLVYEEFLRQLADGPPIRLRGTPLKRLLWRAIGLTSILWFRKIPAAVNAPREIRPETEERSADAVLAELEDRVRRFNLTFDGAWRTMPRRTLQHPLFGRVSLDQSIRFLTVHTRHHAAFLPPAPLQSNR